MTELGEGNSIRRVRFPLIYLTGTFRHGGHKAVGRSARLLALLQALRDRRRPVTAATLARELEESERTIYRDLSQLTSQGAPIHGEAGVGYILGPGLFLPPLMLTEDETEAVLLGLRYVDQRGDEVLTKASRSARQDHLDPVSRFAEDCGRTVGWPRTRRRGVSRKRRIARRPALCDPGGHTYRH
jgi:biotin operon repressor